MTKTLLWVNFLLILFFECSNLSGWANAYEFSDADLRVACDTLDAAVDSVAQGRANVAPEKLPWSTLRTLLSQCIYGGKIDNEFDQVLAAI